MDAINLTDDAKASFRWWWRETFLAIKSTLPQMCNPSDNQFNGEAFLQHTTETVVATKHPPCNKFEILQLTCCFKQTGHLLAACSGIHVWFQIKRKKLLDVFPHLYKFETSTSCLIKLLEQWMSNVEKLAAFGCLRSFSISSAYSLHRHKCPHLDPHHFRDRHPGKSGKHETSALDSPFFGLLKDSLHSKYQGLARIIYNDLSFRVLRRGIEGLRASLSLSSTHQQFLIGKYRETWLGWRGKPPNYLSKALKMEIPSSSSDPCGQKINFQIDISVECNRAFLKWASKNSPFQPPYVSRHRILCGIEAVCTLLSCQATARDNDDFSRIGYNGYNYMNIILYISLYIYVYYLYMLT